MIKGGCVTETPFLPELLDLPAAPSLALVSFGCLLYTCSGICVSHQRAHRGTCSRNWFPKQTPSHKSTPPDLRLLPQWVGQSPERQVPEYRRLALWLLCGVACFPALPAELKAILQLNTHFRLSSFLGLPCWLSFFQVPPDSSPPRTASEGTLSKMGSASWVSEMMSQLHDLLIMSIINY